MVRYWLEFDSLETGSLPFGVSLGCGVTAANLDDALSLVRERLFAHAPTPRLRRIVQDVDVKALDPGHVLPNMGDVTRRGIWFPLGYD